MEMASMFPIPKYKKNCCNCAVFYCDAKHSDILLESSHVRCYLFLFIFMGYLLKTFIWARTMPLFSTILLLSFAVEIPALPKSKALCLHFNTCTNTPCFRIDKDTPVI